MRSADQTAVLRPCLWCALSEFAAPLAGFAFQQAHPVGIGSWGFGMRLLGDMLAGAYQCSASACAMAFIAHRRSATVVVLHGVAFQTHPKVAKPGELLFMAICCELLANGGSPQMPRAVYIFPRTSVGC